MKTTKVTKNPKIRLDIEFAEAILAARAWINSHDLKNVELFRKGKKVKMHNLEEFRMMGLANVNYISMKMYRKDRSKI